MRINTKLTTILLLLAVSFSSINAACNTDILDKFLTRAANNRKESANEPDYPTFTTLASPTTTGFDKAGICGQIWTDAQGTCCTQESIKARKDRLIAKIQKRINKRKELATKGKDSLKNIEKLEAKINAGAAGATSKGKGAKLEEARARLAKIKEKSANNDALAAQAATKMNTCMKAIVEARVAVWCLACANTGGSPLDTTNYFTTAKVQVKQPTCEKLIDSCGEVYGFGRRFIAGEKAFRKAQKALKGEEPDAETELTNTDLDDDADCIADLTACKANSTKRRGFCAKFNLNNEGGNEFGNTATNSNLDATALPSARLLTSERLMQETAVDVETNGPASESDGAGYDVNTH